VWCKRRTVKRKGSSHSLRQKSRNREKKIKNTEGGRDCCDGDLSLEREINQTACEDKQKSVGNDRKEGHEGTSNLLVLMAGMAKKKPQKKCGRIVARRKDKRKSGQSEGPGTRSWKRERGRKWRLF